jgi:S1-C subfamily serine protease
VGDLFDGDAGDEPQQLFGDAPVNSGTGPGQEPGDSSERSPWEAAIAAASEPTTSGQPAPHTDAPTPRRAGVLWPEVTSSTPRATAATRGVDRSTRRPWFSIALVAAVVGALIGGGVVWVARGTNGPTNITIRQGGRAPGAEVLNGGESIPSLVRQVSPSVVSVNVTTSSEEDQGTGMILSTSGLVLTNNHVVAAAEQSQGIVTVTRTGTSTALPASLLGYSTTDDMALLQIQGASNLPAITFGNSSELAVGDAVVAIGNALGLAAGTPTVTQGIVSALGRTVTASSEITNQTETLHNMIQTDAAINPGNSGGPLIDSNGQVIGMNTAVAGTTDDGSNAENIGFAIPAAKIEQLLPQLLRAKVTAKARRKGSYLGVFIQSVTNTFAAEYGLTVSHGAYVDRTIAGFPAAKDGIRPGDVIIKIGTIAIQSADSVESALRSIVPGSTVPIVVVRASATVTLHVTVAAPPAGF